MPRFPGGRTNRRKSYFGPFRNGVRDRFVSSSNPTVPTDPEEEDYFFSWDTTEITFDNGSVDFSRESP